MKPKTVNVGTIGHVDHSKSMLSYAIACAIKNKYQFFPERIKAETKIDIKE